MSFLRDLPLRLRRAIRAFEAEPTVPPAPDTPITFTITLQRDHLDGGYIAECVDLPGCMSQGETQQEAFENILEAITEVLGVRLERSSLPPITDPSESDDSRKVAVTV